MNKNKMVGFLVLISLNFLYSGDKAKPRSFDDPDFVAATRLGLAECAAGSLCAAAEIYLGKATSKTVHSMSLKNKCGFSVIMGQGALICRELVAKAIKAGFKPFGAVYERKDSELYEYSIDALKDLGIGSILGCFSEATSLPLDKAKMLFDDVVMKCVFPFRDSLLYTIDTADKAWEAFVIGGNVNSISIPGCKVEQQWGVHKAKISLGQTVTDIYNERSNIKSCQLTCNKLTWADEKRKDEVPGKRFGHYVTGIPQKTFMQMAYTLECVSDAKADSCTRFCLANSACRHSCSAMGNVPLEDNTPSIRGCIDHCNKVRAKDDLENFISKKKIQEAIDKVKNDSEYKAKEEQEKTAAIEKEKTKPNFVNCERDLKEAKEILQLLTNKGTCKAVVEQGNLHVKIIDLKTAIKASRITCANEGAKTQSIRSVMVDYYNRIVPLYNERNGNNFVMTFCEEFNKEKTATPSSNSDDNNTH